MKAKLFTLALVSLLLIGCVDEKTRLLDWKAMLQKSIPKDEDALARHFIDLVRTGDYDQAQQLLTPSLRGDQARLALQQLHGLFDHGEPLEIEPIGYSSSTFHSSSQDVSKIDLFYQIHFKDSWVAGDVLIDQKTDPIDVLGSHFHPISDSLEVLNRFTLSGKSSLHFAVLAFCILIPAFILYALVVCIRSPIRRKWLWIIFILFGLIRFRFDWTTGLYDIQPLTLQLLGVGCVQASPYSPWLFELALPVGALVFLIRRRKLIKPPVHETPNQAQPEQTS
jgi:hypothetical protein